ACPLYVWKTMQMKDGGRGTSPRASAGRAGDAGSFPRSFTFHQILSRIHLAEWNGCQWYKKNWGLYYAPSSFDGI
ncbi:hypothetical protein, partial [Aeromonas caviae]|uniref:hypothetical protein n=1 Tax=Aeromonas caviae TaxID=648 RepID=UPI001CC80F08